MNWKKFYQERVNSTYQDYFEQRYAVMLDAIVDTGAERVREEGIGIGSITKALTKRGLRSYGFDNCEDMVILANINNGRNVACKQCILTYTQSINFADLVVTHGVLEHFQDEDIRKIAARHRKDDIQAIHYVPTDKYCTPSFGDERLLSVEKWIDLVGVKSYHLFNDGYDLLLLT